MRTQWMRQGWRLGLLATMVGALTTGCTTPPRTHSDTPAPATWMDWRQRRHESAAGIDGWTTIVGLYWLSEGRHTVGPNATNSIRVGRSGPVGEFVRDGSNVWFHPAPGHSVNVGDTRIENPIQLVADVPGPATKLTHGDHQLWLLKRGDRWAIRVRDRSAPARRHFRGLTYFPWQADWVIEAHFAAHPPGTTLPITDVTGATKQEPNPGALIFRHAGGEYRLETLADDEAHDLFILFRDDTNGDTTYAPGRFLHAPLPDDSGRVLLDFNRAYNPPCAFTDSATCPRPPAANRLPFPVSAGEKKY